MSRLERDLKARVERAILFLKEMQEESDLRFEPEDPYQFAIDDLRNTVFGIAAMAENARREVDSWRRAIRDPKEVALNDLESLTESARARGLDRIQIAPIDVWKLASDPRAEEER